MYSSGKRRKRGRKAAFAAMPPPIIKVGDGFKVSVELIVLKGGSAGAHFRLKGENNSADRVYMFQVDLVYLNGENIASKESFRTVAEPGEKVEKLYRATTRATYPWNSLKVAKISVVERSNSEGSSFNIGHILPRSVLSSLDDYAVEQNQRGRVS